MRSLVATTVVALILGGCAPGEPSPSALEGAPSAPPAQTSAAPAPSDDAWQRVADEAAFVDPLGPTEVVALAARPSGVIAVGRGPLGAVAWTSRDGIEWTRSAEDGPEGDGFTQVAGRGDAWIAAAIGPGGADADISLYVSGNGEVWRPTAAFGNRRAGGVRLVETPAAVLAFAGDVDGTSVNVTTDGTGWSELASAAFGQGWVTRAARYGDVLVAAGSTWTQPPEARAWTAPDGGSWTSAELPAGARHPVTVAADSSGFVLVNTWQAASGPAAWRSTDGRQWSPWTEYLPPGDVFGFWAFPASADAGGDVYVATTLGSDSSPVQHDIWVSHDGRTWARQRLILASDASAPAAGGEIVHANGTGVWDPHAIYVNDVARVGSHLLAVGSIGSEAAIWLAPPVGPVNPAPSPTPAPCASPPVDLPGLIAVPIGERRACLDDRSIVLRGVVTATNPRACRFQPEDSLACRPGVVVAIMAGPRVWNLLVVLGPELVDVEPARLVGQPIELVARYDHPAAPGCAPADGPNDPPLPGDAMVDACRALLVATEVRLAGGDPQP